MTLILAEPVGSLAVVDASCLSLGVVPMAIEIVHFDDMFSWC